MPDASKAASSNHLLAAVPTEQLSHLLPAGSVDQLERGTQLFASGDTVEDLVFPLEGMVSITIETVEGMTVEVAVVGAEGFAGMDRYLGSPTASTNAVVQVAGQMARVRADDFIQAVNDVPALQGRIARYLRSLLIETSQTAVCNQLHSVEQRTARWLLHAADRAGTLQLRLTHEFLAQMLAVRRPSVTTVVGIFTRAGLMETQRGLISIADADGLRAFTCECYEVVKGATAA